MGQPDSYRLSSFWQRASAWSQDHILRRVLRNSSYLFLSNAVSALMVILTSRLLGVASFGALGAITGFVTGINRLLSFRMSDVVVRYMGEYMARKEYDRAAALVKAAGMLEGLTSIAAFGVLVLLAPLGAQYIIKDPGVTPLILLYGLSILGNITTETATGVLQVTNHYRSQALINLIQTVIVAAIITAAFFTHTGLAMVVTAYLIGKIILGLMPIAVALYHMGKLFGQRWWRADLHLLPPRRELVRFALSTNFSGTVNLIVRDSEVLWISYFLNTTFAGYYKAALTLIQLVVMPITPFVNTTYPELNRAIVLRQWERLRSLIRRITTIAGAWTGFAALGLILLGRQVIFTPWSFFGQPVLLFGKAFSPFKPSFMPAYPALLILLIGFGMANILFWNRSLCLALGLPDYPLKVYVWGAAAKVALAFLLVPAAGDNGYLVEAGLLSGFFVVTVGLTVWRGLSEVRRISALEPVGAVE
ncbi:MAG TPA: oligosaccharide flippase family protein [Anaerolineaceae bacterium]